MVSKSPASSTSSGTGPPTKLRGAVAGGLTVLGFLVIHDLWISDIWFNVGPMVFAGALCGLCIVWSYNTAASDHSAKDRLATTESLRVFSGIGGVSYGVRIPPPRFLTHM